MDGKTVDVQAEPDPMPVAGQRPGPPFFAVLIVAGVIVICAGLQSAASIVAPIFLVITLVITVAPLRALLVQRRWPSWLASAVTLLAIYLLITLILGSVVFGLVDLALFTYPVVWPFIGPALVGMVIVGFPAAAVGTAYTTLQQTSAPDSHRGRVVGALMAAASVGSLFGAVAAGVLGEVVPVIALLIVQGSGYVLAGLLVARMVGRRASPGAAFETA